MTKDQAFLVSRIEELELVVTHLEAELEKAKAENAKLKQAADQVVKHFDHSDCLRWVSKAVCELEEALEEPDHE